MEQLVDYLLQMNEHTAMAAIFFILLACGLGVPIPEDITLIAAGLLAYYEVGSVWSMIIIGFLGVMIGDTIVFYIGHHYGKKILKKPFFKRFLPPEKYEEVSKTFKKRGKKILFAARFMPGLRAPMFFSAGSLGVPYYVFLLLDGSAALISVPAIVYSVYALGDEIDYVVHIIKKVQHGILFAIAAGILFFAGRWYVKHRRRSRNSAV